MLTVDSYPNPQGWGATSEYMYKALKVFVFGSIYLKSLMQLSDMNIAH